MSAVLHPVLPAAFVVVPPIELDCASAPPFADQLLAASPSSSVVVDLSGVRFCDSSGLAALLRARDHLDGLGRLALRGPSPSFVRLLTVAGLTDAFTIEPDPGPPEGSLRTAAAAAGSGGLDLTVHNVARGNCIEVVVTGRAGAGDVAETSRRLLVLATRQPAQLIVDLSHADLDAATGALLDAGLVELRSVLAREGGVLVVSRTAAPARPN